MFSSEPNGQTYTTFSSSYRPWTPPSPTKIMSWNSAHKFLIQGVRFDDISSSTICSSWVLKCVIGDRVPLWASWYMSDSYPQDKTFLTITKRGDTLNLESCSESEVCFGQFLQKKFVLNWFCCPLSTESAIILYNPMCIMKCSSLQTHGDNRVNMALNCGTFLHPRYANVLEFLAQWRRPMTAVMVGHPMRTF